MNSLKYIIIKIKILHWWKRPLTFFIFSGESNEGILLLIQNLRTDRDE